MASAGQTAETKLSGEHWWSSLVAHDDNLWKTKLMLRWVFSDLVYSVLSRIRGMLLSQEP